VSAEAPHLEFGVEDSPDCPLCGNQMPLSRRIAHQGFVEEFEVQTFTCGSCDVHVQRTIDESGGLYR
jgi:hypothetical protein